MAIFNRDEAEGKIDKTKGTVKEQVGKWTGDDSLRAEGEADRAAGESQETWGKFKRGVSETIDSVGDAVSNAGKKINK